MLRFRRRGGFTLIEILVVVTIIVMAFGFATPTISKFLSNRKVKSITSRLARGLQAGRMRAITKHCDVYVFFLRDRLMLVSARPEVPEFFTYFNDDNERSKMSIHVRFADARVRHDPRPDSGTDQLRGDLPPLPPDVAVTDPVAGKTVLKGLDNWVLEGKHAYLLFKSEGTVEFGSDDGPGDVLPMGFWATPPIDADVIVEELDNKNHGWIDIRPTGNVDVRIEEGSPALDEPSHANEEVEKS